MPAAKMCPKKQGLAKTLRYLEAQAQKEARILGEHDKRLSRAYYGVAIPSAILAIAATATALAEYTMIAGMCAGVAAFKSSILVYLRNPYEKAHAERVIGARYIALQTDAHALRLSACDSDISYESLESEVNRLKTELKTLRLSRYSPSASVAHEVSPATRSELAQARS